MNIDSRDGTGESRKVATRGASSKRRFLYVLKQTAKKLINDSRRFNTNASRPSDFNIAGYPADSGQCVPSVFVVTCVPMRMERGCMTSLMKLR